MDSIPSQPKFSLHGFMAGRPFLSSFLIATAILALTFLFYLPHFQYNDDVQVLLLLKGVGMVSAPSAMNQRENILLCWILKGLYTYFPAVPWYSGFLVLTQFLSLWATLAAFRIGPHPRLRTWLFIFSAAYINVYFFTNLQWTMTASLAALGTVFLSASLWRAENQKPSPISYAILFFLVTASIQIRYPSFFLIAAISLPVLWVLTWKKPLTPSRSALLRFWLAAMGFSLFTIAFNHYYYQRFPGWVQSIEFFDQHFELHETRDPVYDEETKPVFDSVGWTANDLDLFQSWYFLDEKTYSVDHLRKLNDYFPKFSLHKPTNYSLAKKIAFPTTQIMIYFFLGALWLVPARSRRFLLAAASWTLFVLFFLMIYEKLPERVFLPALFFLSTLAVFHTVPIWENPPSGKTRSSWAVPMALVLLAFLSIFTAYFLYQEHARNGRWVQCREMMRTVQDEFHPQDNQLYVLWDSAFPYECVDAFGDYGLFRHFNIVALTWFQRSPTTAAMLARFGVKDLLRDLVDNPNLLLVCTQPEMDAYQIHMWEKYQMKTQAQVVYMSPLFAVCRILSEK